MFRVVKNSWQSGVSLATLKYRAELLQKIRAFFEERQVLEVQTPVLCRSAATDLHLNPFPVSIAQTDHYLQTSPEFPMKRLLAQFKTDIYQITHAFRDEELGAQHNTEFWMLEWYRVGWTYQDLMREVASFVEAVAGTPITATLSYQDVFVQKIGLDPFNTSVAILQKKASEYNLETTLSPSASLADWCELFFSLVITPTLGLCAPVIIKDFPAASASLAQLSLDIPPRAMRFELYWKGLELGNGYHELLDAAELKKRFVEDTVRRKAESKPLIPHDEALLAAMEAGLPPCAGIAVGIDRLLMAILGVSTISEVISFTAEKA